MMRSVTCIWLCILALALCGCGKKRAPASKIEAESALTNNAPKAASEPLAISEMSPDDVIASVNGVALTRRAYDEMLHDIDSLFRAANPKLSPMQWETHRKRRERTLVSEFLTKQVLLQEARRRGLKPSLESRAALSGVLETVARKTGVPVGDLGASADPEIRRVMDSVEEQALIMTLRQDQFGKKLKVTEADVGKARDWINRYNAMCEQTNALVKARASAISERLRSGEDFVKVAAAESEYQEDEPGIWGTFARSDIEDAHVRHAAFTLPVGAVSEPFDTEEGMVIIKVLERTGEAASVFDDDVTVKLGRLLLRLGQSKTLPSPAALRRELENARLTELQRPWLAELQSKAVVDFPHGTDLWKEVVKKKNP